MARQTNLSEKDKELSIDFPDYVLRSQSQYNLSLDPASTVTIMNNDGKKAIIDFLVMK